MPRVLLWVAAVTDPHRVDWDAFVTSALLCVGVLEGAKRALLDAVDAGARMGNCVSRGGIGLDAATGRLKEATALLDALRADVAATPPACEVCELALANQEPTCSA